MSSTSERTLHEGRRYGKEVGAGPAYAPVTPFHMSQDFQSSSPWGIPDLEPYTGELPEKLEPFLRRKWSRTTGVHFYLDDVNFEVVWNSPNRYLEMFKVPRVVLTPDFSLYTDWPKASQIWNTYRNRWCGAYWQSKGLNVIPTLGWAEPDSYEFAFDGVPPESPVCVSTIGCARYPDRRALFEAGYNEMVKRLTPSIVLVFGRLWFPSKSETVLYSYDWDQIGDSYGS